MLFGTILLSSALLANGMTDNRVAEARYQDVLENQCEEVLGFAEGTEAHMDCQLFYEKLFRRLYGISDSMSLSAVQRVEQKIEQLNTACQKHYGDKDIPAAALWRCIQKQGELERDEKTYQDKRYDRRRH